MSAMDDGTITPGAALRWATRLAQDAMYAEDHKAAHEAVCGHIVVTILTYTDGQELAAALNSEPTLGPKRRMNRQGYVWSREARENSKMPDLKVLTRAWVAAKSGGSPDAFRRAWTRLKALGVLATIEVEGPRRVARGVSIRALQRLSNGCAGDRLRRFQQALNGGPKTKDQRTDTPQQSDPDAEADQRTGTPAEDSGGHQCAGDRCTSAPGDRGTSAPPTEGKVQREDISRDPRSAGSAEATESDTADPFSSPSSSATGGSAALGAEPAPTGGGQEPQPEAGAAAAAAATTVDGPTTTSAESSPSLPRGLTAVASEPQLWVDSKTRDVLALPLSMGLDLARPSGVAALWVFAAVPTSRCRLPSNAQLDALSATCAARLKVGTSALMVAAALMEVAARIRTGRVGEDGLASAVVARLDALELNPEGAPNDTRERVEHADALARDGSLRWYVEVADAFVAGDLTNTADTLEEFTRTAAEDVGFWDDDDPGRFNAYCRGQLGLAMARCKQSRHPPHRKAG